MKLDLGAGRGEDDERRQCREQLGRGDAGQTAGVIHFPDTPWREPSVAVFRHAGTVLCKRMPCRTERGDCLFHLGTAYEA